MMEVCPRGASNPDPRGDARRPFVRLLSARQLRLAAAGFMLAGCLGISGGAYAQPKDAAAGQSGDCLAKCAKDKEDCYQAGSTDEYCSYELTACKKACSKP